MTKKYLPLIVLFAAALLLYFVKKNQRGTLPAATTERVTVPVITGEGFDRNTLELIYSKHARCRMECRHIDETEVKEILQSGKLNYARIEEDDRGKTFPLEGITRDQQHVRIVFAPRSEQLVVVTVIDLDRDWDCDCKDP